MKYIGGGLEHVEKRAFEILKLFKNGQNITEIANSLGLHKTTVRKHLKRCIPVKEEVDFSKKKFHHERNAFILDGIKKGKTLQKLGLELDISRERVRQLVLKTGMHKTFKRIFYNKKIFRHKQIVNDFKDGVPEKVLAKKYKLHKRSIHLILREGIKNYQSEYYRGLEERNREIKALFKKGKRIVELASRFDLSYGYTWSLIRQKKLSKLKTKRK